MVVLNHYQVSHKIQRLAFEILENSLSDPEIVLLGINKNGYRFAQLLHTILTANSEKPIFLYKLSLNPSSPLENDIKVDVDTARLKDRKVIIVDDVANTGRTLFYAFTAIMDVLLPCVEVAVLVDRKHKKFPVMVDYVGLSLATTMQEHIKAHINDASNMTVELI
ncbi:MAG: phosphoribosyltransferase family protein [Saprospiraceae bacterium]